MSKWNHVLIVAVQIIVVVPLPLVVLVARHLVIIIWFIKILKIQQIQKRSEKFLDCKEDFIDTTFIQNKLKLINSNASLYPDS